MPAITSLLATLIDEALKEYLPRLFYVAMVVVKTGPPALTSMPDVVTPTLSALSHYIRGGSLKVAKAAAA